MIGVNGVVRTTNGNRCVLGERHLGVTVFRRLLKRA